eukprot:CAMPEP_0201571462 /NCGR_PEP_ID=MMETSP0190_2-20130828/14238_1 /ASSEMBLY_ACC=CAM_ASM_000263 /TAXON_ID=37353 /ORGANISM="Rosalina sp." /LENGTH=150 /DNA_ID=CAMNT_0047996133 /DNA_START=274 /DNA_END=726 /DNA_ORIENTATION=+
MKEVSYRKWKLSSCDESGKLRHTSYLQRNDPATHCGIGNFWGNQYEASLDSACCPSPDGQPIHYYFVLKDDKATLKCDRSEEVIKVTKVIVGGVDMTLNNPIKDECNGKSICYPQIDKVLPTQPVVDDETETTVDLEYLCYFDLEATSSW